MSARACSNSLAMSCRFSCDARKIGVKPSSASKSTSALTARSALRASTALPATAALRGVTPFLFPKSGSARCLSSRFTTARWLWKAAVQRGVSPREFGVFASLMPWARMRSASLESPSCAASYNARGPKKRWIAEFTSSYFGCVSGGSATAFPFAPEMRFKMFLLSSGFDAFALTMSDLMPLRATSAGNQSPSTRTRSSRFPLPSSISSVNEF
mmetsp:Transcript_102291/g.203061  ORF Transcript_102291/g.203061 Transcript_102291/m.203061 type:complete len:213 (+) Transcript_102291:439-1077(+)